MNTIIPARLITGYTDKGLVKLIMDRAWVCRGRWHVLAYRRGIYTDGKILIFGISDKIKDEIKNDKFTIRQDIDISSDHQLETIANGLNESVNRVVNEYDWRNIPDIGTHGEPELIGEGKDAYCQYRFANGSIFNAKYIRTFYRLFGSNLIFRQSEDGKQCYVIRRNDCTDYESLVGLIMPLLDNNK